MSDKSSSISLWKLDICPFKCLYTNFSYIIYLSNLYFNCCNEVGIFFQRQHGIVLLKGIDIIKIYNEIIFGTMVPEILVKIINNCKINIHRVHFIRMADPLILRYKNLATTIINKLISDHLVRCIKSIVISHITFYFVRNW